MVAVSARAGQEASLAFSAPMLPGFHPDPSVVLVDGWYYLVNSTFEYLPGIPIHRSRDFASWEAIGHVVTQERQIGVAGLASGLGVWAPTIRYRDGVFFVIVTVAGSARGCVVFATKDPAGAWSEGTTIEGVDGIDPDLAWGEDGTAYVTYSALSLSGPQQGLHRGIEQVRVDLETGHALEAPRTLWSGSGLQFPEAPHLYQRDGYWYLLIAEGGTERGHAVSAARASSPEGPFVSAPGNPLLSARSTDRSVQSTGHGDLVQGPDGTDLLVLLGVRPLGLSRSFSPLGRETFVTVVDWVDGWPIPRVVELGSVAPVRESFDLAQTAALEDPGWLAPRQTPSDVVQRTSEGAFVLRGDGQGMSSRQPAFVGRRQRHLVSTTSVTVRVGAGSGGIALRYDEEFFVTLAATLVDGRTALTATATVAGITQQWTDALTNDGEVELQIATSKPPFAFSQRGFGGDRITLIALGDGQEVTIAELDGRHWAVETVVSFTGRVIGPFALQGDVEFAAFTYEGIE